MRQGVGVHLWNMKIIIGIYTEVAKRETVDTDIMAVYAQ